MTITSRMIGIFLFAGAVLALAISFIISTSLAKAISTRTNQSAVEMVFGAIESGPLAIARLNSQEIAQQELSRLMSNSRISTRGISRVEITGGLDQNFHFAHWESPARVKPGCNAFESREYNFTDAIHPYKINVSRDVCYQPEEHSTIILYSIFASILAEFFCALVLYLATRPVISSLKLAEQAIENPSAWSDEFVSFLPIRKLVTKSIRSIELEKGAALASLAAQVSHDIRSPLSALAIVVSTIEIPAEKRQILQNAMARINGIAGGLLASARPESSHARDERKELTEVNSVLNAVLAEKRIEYSGMQDIVIEDSFDENSKMLVDLDEVTLSRVISNLINNAVEACGPAGKIVVATRASKKSVVIVVSDNGAGIPDSILSKLGEKGVTHRPQDRKNKSESGNGLGLFHAYETIQSAGGSIAIQSKLGTGTFVNLTLPTVANLC